MILWIQNTTCFLATVERKKTLWSNYVRTWKDVTDFLSLTNVMIAYQLEKIFPTISLLQSKDVMLEW